MKSWESGKYCFYGIHSQYTHRLSRTMGKCGFFSQTRKKTLLYPRLTSFGNNNNIIIDLRKQKNTSVQNNNTSKLKAYKQRDTNDNV